MAQYVLVKDGRILNYITAEPGWEHPDGDLIPMEEFTVEAARKKGIPIAASDQDVLSAYNNNQPIVVGRADTVHIFELLQMESLPVGYILPSETTLWGQARLSVTPWEVKARQAAVWVDIIKSAGVDLQSVWFSVPWEHPLGWAAFHFACLLSDIKCQYSRTPPEGPITVATGLSSYLVRVAQEKLVPPSTVLASPCTGIMDAQVQAITAEGYTVIDQYAINETGIIAMTKHTPVDGGYESATYYGSGTRPRIGVNGTIEVPVERVATHYLNGRPIAVNNGYYDTGDKAKVNSKGVLRVLERSIR